MEDNISYDIFEWFPVLVCQNVFKYLDGKDVIQASGVSKEWNKLCAERPQVDKLKLVFDCNNIAMLTKADVDFLKNSNRKYQHIECSNISLKGDVLSFIGSIAWKSVRLIELKFDD